MSAAKPSRATISNTIAAVLTQGLTPAAVIVAPDGTVHVTILQRDQSVDPVESVRQDDVLSWDDVQ